MCGMVNWMKRKFIMIISIIGVMVSVKFGLFCGIGLVGEILFRLKFLFWDWVCILLFSLGSVLLCLL